MHLFQPSPGKRDPRSWDKCDACEDYLMDWIRPVEVSKVLNGWCCWKGMKNLKYKNWASEVKRLMMLNYMISFATLFRFVKRNCWQIFWSCTSSRLFTLKVLKRLKVSQNRWRFASSVFLRMDIMWISKDWTRWLKLNKKTEAVSAESVKCLILAQYNFGRRQCEDVLNSLLKNQEPVLKISNSAKYDSNKVNYT